MRTAIATVCISGTLEDKLVAAAAAGFDGVEIFEPDFVASSVVGGRGARPVRRTGAVHRPVPTRSATSTACTGGDPAGQSASRGTQVRRDGAVGHRPHPGLLLRRTRRVGRRRPIAEQLHQLASRGRRPGLAGVVRGTGLGPLREHLRAVVGDRPGRRSPGARTVRRQLPHPVPRFGPGRHRADPGREALLPATRRRPVHGHGRAAVEPALPGCSPARAPSTCPRSSATC